MMIELGKGTGRLQGLGNCTNARCFPVHVHAHSVTNYIARHYVCDRDSSMEGKICENWRKEWHGASKTNRIQCTYACAGMRDISPSTS